jgi:transcription-repair coupling factor (superfamily II helicase)
MTRIIKRSRKVKKTGVMELEAIVNNIRAASTGIFTQVMEGRKLPSLGLRRSARLPWLAALIESMGRSLLLITDRNDHALMLEDELSLWAPKTPRLFFPEPTPLFYENAPWGLTTRRDRLMVLTTLADFTNSGSHKAEALPIIIAPVRSIRLAQCPGGIS